MITQEKNFHQEPKNTKINSNNDNDTIGYCLQKLILDKRTSHSPYNLSLDGRTELMFQLYMKIGFYYNNTFENDIVNAKT